MNKLVRLFATSLLLLSSSVFAATINYTISGNGSGSLAGLAFTDQDFSISLIGDTANFSSPGYDVIDPLNSATVAINGFGTTTLDLPTRLGISGNIVFFSRAGSGGLDLFDFFLDAPVDLQSAFGPVMGTSVFALDQFVNVSTSLGALTFSDSTSVNFSAAVVPEPETWAMLLAGMGVSALAIRRRRLQSA